MLERRIKRFWGCINWQLELWLQQQMLLLLLLQGRVSYAI
jgi:hypothetical protein